MEPDAVLGIVCLVVGLLMPFVVIAMGLAAWNGPSSLLWWGSKQAAAKKAEEAYRDRLYAKEEKPITDGKYR